MISDNLNKLFQFIDYLYTNIDNFKQYDDAVNEIFELSDRYRKLRPDLNFSQKQESDEVRLKHTELLNVVREKIHKPIFDKLSEIGIKNGNEYTDFYNDISEIKKDCKNQDVSIIRANSNKYNVVQNELGEKKMLLYGLENSLEINELNRAANVLFSFFSEQPEAVIFNDNKEVLTSEPIEKQKSKLTMSQIALKYIYEGLIITAQNSNDIAKQYGHNSGEKISQWFTYYSSLANRKGRPYPCTAKKLDNKIKLIESVIELLPIDNQERAKDEVSILKKIYETEYQ